MPRVLVEGFEHPIDLPVQFVKEGRFVWVFPREAGSMLKQIEEHYELITDLELGLAMFVRKR